MLPVAVGTGVSVMSGCIVRHRHFHGYPSKSITQASSGFSVIPGGEGETGRAEWRFGCLGGCREWESRRCRLQ